MALVTRLFSCWWKFVINLGLVTGHYVFQITIPFVMQSVSLVIPLSIANRNTSLSDSGLLDIFALGFRSDLRLEEPGVAVFYPNFAKLHLQVPQYLYFT